ncbi:hypothetical protein V1512DRAFT_268543 [Lipomyces arxii]|uniref:mitochondrial 37S ribosomal protein uS17m n=1 Tax=Lipomyces arxii TaxID=56418 RepID=UPI0034CF9726
MRQNFLGMVISQGKMAKTIKVRVQIPVKKSRLNAVVNKRHDFLVHDEGEICREGDIVRIESTRPLSARKFFAVAEIKNPIGQVFQKYSNFTELEAKYTKYLVDNQFRLAATEQEYDEYSKALDLISQNKKLTHGQRKQEQKKLDHQTRQKYGKRWIIFREDGMPLYFHRLKLDEKLDDDFYKLYHRKEVLNQEAERTATMMAITNKLGKAIDTNEFWSDYRAYQLLYHLGDDKVADSSFLNSLSQELGAKYKLQSWPPNVSLLSTSLQTRAQKFSEEARRLRE